jgi:hypothetical protein
MQYNAIKIQEIQTVLPIYLQKVFVILSIVIKSFNVKMQTVSLICFPYHFDLKC